MEHCAEVFARVADQIIDDLLDGNLYYIEKQNREIPLSCYLRLFGRGLGHLF